MGRYAIVRRLAMGPTAEVFLASATDAAGDLRPVAVKKLLPMLAEDPRVVKRFWREARLAMAVRHNNLVQVLDYGTDEDGGCSMVMEFVDGADLRAILEGSTSVEGGIGLREAGAITLAVVDGLAYLHSARDGSGKGLGLIHRNVNPANVLISRRGEVKLGDLGLARLASDSSAHTRNTVVAKEQANYLSPEQAMARKLDQRADIFLAGLLFYELLSGSPLFQGPSPLGLVRGFDVARIPELPDVPPPVRAVLEKALAREPAARYQTAKEMGDDLGRFLEARRLRARPDDLAALLARSLPGRPSASSLGSDEHAGVLELTRPVANAERRPVVARKEEEEEAPPPPPSQAQGARPKPRHAEAAADPKQRGSKQKLGEILVAKGRLDQDQLDDALERQRREGGKLGEHLRSEGVSEITLIRAMSLQSGVPFVTDDKLDATAPPRELTKRLPRSVAQRLAAVPLLLRGDALFVAMMVPTDRTALEELRRVTRAASVQGVFATEGAIDRALSRFYPLPQEDEPADEETTGVVDMRSIGMKPDTATSGVREAGGGVLRSPPPPPVADTDPATPVPAGAAGEDSAERKLLEGTLRMLGGVAAEGKTLGALAQRLAARLGAPPPEEDRAYLAGIALAVAVKFEGRSPFERPSRASLRAVFGQGIAGLEDALSHATRDLTKGGAPESPLPAALAAAAAFVEAAGSATPTPDIASFALSEIEDDERVSKAALAALGTVVAEVAYRG